MLNKDLESMIDKLALQQETGVSQFKHKRTRTVKNFEGQGTGLGAIIGAASGAMAKKYKGLAMAGSAIGGALLGRLIGRKSISRTEQRVSEAVIKKQDRGETAKIPRLNDAMVLKSIGYNKK